VNVRACVCGGDSIARLHLILLFYVHMDSFKSNPSLSVWAGHETVMHDTKVKENHVSADDVWLMKPQVVPVPLRESVLFIGTEFSNLYTALDMPAEAA
jgi:hypothetical protein